MKLERDLSKSDLQTKEVNKKLEFIIAKTVAAFMNSEGGNLLIGVDDNQNVLGLADDLSTFTKQNLDGFELHLLEVLKRFIGPGMLSHINISFPKVGDIQICHLKISRSSKLVFIQDESKESLFVRAGYSSIPLNREQQSEYEKHHWGNK